LLPIIASQKFDAGFRYIDSGRCDPCPVNKLVCDFGGKALKEEKMMIFNKLVLLVVSFFVLVAAAPRSVVAQEAEKEAGWKFALELYLWGASIGGKTGSGSDISVDFADLLKRLNMGFMGAAAARKGKWTLLADVIYLNVQDDTRVFSGVKLNAELAGLVVNSSVGYNLVETERGRLLILGGVRYLYLDLGLGLGPLGRGNTGSNWDGVVGVKGIVNLTEKWYLAGYLDVGTGESKVTWQAIGGIGYRFKWFDVNGGYRYLRWDFDNTEIVDDLDFHGPFAGVKFDF